MAGELPRPDVQVIQKIRASTPSFVRPTLVPCVVGPAFEVLKVLTSDGTINSKARWGAYEQMAIGITESAFPDPRGNIDELDILEDTVRPFMLSGKALTELPLAKGNAFLCTSHGAKKAAIRTKVFGTGIALDGKSLVLAFDVPARLDTSKDVVVTFVGAGDMTAETAATQINEQVGQAVATVIGTGTDKQVQIASPRYGALSSITVRKGASANALLHLGLKTVGVTDTALEERVEGAGYRAQPDSNNDTVSPWIEFFRGAYYQDGIEGEFNVAEASQQAGLVDLAGTFSSAKAAAVTFGDGNTVPVHPGDYVYMDGTRLQSAEISRVEAGRFRVGTINATLSTADANGNYTRKVYDTVQVGTLLDTTPLAPTYVYFKANDIDWTRVAPTAATLTSASASKASAAVKGSVVGGTINAGTAVAGLTLHYVSTHAGVETEGTLTFVDGPYDLAGLVVAINTLGIPNVVAKDDGSGKLMLECTTASRLDLVSVLPDGTANATLGFSTSAAVTSTNQADAGWAALPTTTLKFKLDDNPHTYAVQFSSASIDLAVEEINQAVGATVASKGGTGGDTGLLLVLTSTLKGIASKIEVIDSDGGASGAEDIMGLVGGTAVAGTGRPYPDVYMDAANVLRVQSQILRDLVTGAPLDQEFNTGTLYVQYKALRRDVSPSAQVAGVLRMTDIAMLGSVLDPLTEENPLGLGMYLAMLNAPNFECKGLGIDEVTAAAPEGTGAAYARAAALLEAEEVYAIAPLTQDEVIQSLWWTHATVMSEPEQGGERIVFVNKRMPTRKNPVIALSGAQANSTATSDQMLVDGNPAAGLVAAGINPAVEIPETAHVYMEFEVNGELRRYSVKSVSGALVNFRTAFDSVATNADGFYSGTTLDVAVVDAAYKLAVRGASLVVPGSNPVRYDYSLMAETVSDANAAVKNRRVYSVFPDTIKTVVDGIEKSLPGYYACAAIVGMVAAQPPQQSFTNFPMTGLSGVVGSEKFTKRQLNVMAGGGTYILTQETVGAPVSCRHQLSTDLTSIETRELSITRVVDFTAKFLRLAVRKFIGTHVVNDGLMDSLGTTVHAVLKFLEDSGVLNGSNVNNIIQDENNKDTVLIDVTLDVPFPCNYIRVTLVV